MAKKEKLVYPNPKFWKAKDNMDWKKQGANLAEAPSPGICSSPPTGNSSAPIA